MPKKYATSFDFDSEIVWIKDAESYSSATAALNAKVPPEGVTAAKGDGTVDDTNAIQGLIDYAKTSSIKTIFLPPGSYSVQALTLATGVSIMGIDPFNTKLVLRGGATNPLLSGSIQNVTISGITLDANSGAQTGNVSTVVITSGNDVTIRNAIIGGGYVNLSYNGAGGTLIIDEVIFPDAVYKHLLISGEAEVRTNTLIFGDLSQLSANCCMDISTDNGIFQFTSDATTPVCIRCAGTGNRFEGLIRNAVDNFVDTGTDNDYIIYGQSQTENLSGDKKITAANIMETVAGDRTSNVGDETVTATGKISLHGPDIVIDPENPLTYKTPAENNGHTPTIPMKTPDGNTYLIPTGSADTMFMTYDGIVNSSEIAKRAEYFDSGYSVQGGTFYNGNYYIYLFNQSDKINGKIVKFNSEFNKISETPIAGYHGNSICFCPEINAFLFCPLINDTNQILLNSIYVLNADTLEIVGTHNFDINPFAVFNENGKTYIMYHEHPVTDTFYVAELNTTNWALGSPVMFKNPGKTLQDMEIRNGFLYLLDFENPAVVIYDLTGKLWKIIRLPKNVNETYPIGEVENIFRVDDHLEICSYNRFSAGYDRCICNLFALSPLTNEYGGVYNTYNLNVYNDVDLYVGQTTTNNPDGTQENPFASIADALMTASVYPSSQRIYINVADGHTETLEIKYAPFNTRIRPISGSYTIAAKIYNCQRIEIYGAVFTGDLTIQYADALLNGCTINGNVDCTGANVQFTAMKGTATYNLKTFSTLMLSSTTGFNQCTVDATSRCLIPFELTNTAVVGTQIPFKTTPGKQLEIILQDNSLNYAFVIPDRTGKYEIPYTRLVGSKLITCLAHVTVTANNITITKLDKPGEDGTITNDTVNNIVVYSIY